MALRPGALDDLLYVTLRDGRQHDLWLLAGAMREYGVILRRRLLREQLWRDGFQKQTTVTPHPWWWN